MQSPPDIFCHPITFSKSTILRFNARRGSILVVALWCIVILVALVMVSVRTVGVDGTAAANRQAMLQASSIEMGAEQFVLSQVDGGLGDANSATGTYAEALPIGNGYFWILHPDPTTDQNYFFGITDEAGKLNLTTATSAQLQLLPNMTVDLADSIVDWHDSDETQNANGAESSVYNSLSNPYNAKNLPFETVEELMLVNGYSQDILFGQDLNRNGVIDKFEQQANGSATLSTGTGSGTDSRGFFNYVTAWGTEPNTTITGTARTNVNDGAGSVSKVLTTAGLSSKRVSDITNRLNPFYACAATGATANTTRGKTSTSTGAAATPATPATAIAFNDLGSFYAASGMTATEFATVADLLTTTTAKTITGKVNVYTAPSQVLLALGLEQTDADNLVSARINAPFVGPVTATNVPTVAWVYDTLGAAKATKIAPFITARSYQYSADIVAISGDGRSFKRVRIVVDSSYTPAKIIYRRELTNLGWPLDPQIQKDMRAGVFQRNMQGSGTR